MEAIETESIDEHLDTISGGNAAMTLYSTESCIEGHACRIVLYEKQVDCDVQWVDLKKNPARLGELNPYGESPTLMDREIVLYGAHIVAEYLDDRLPHPPLMPSDPVNRGRVRLMLYKFRREWLNELRQVDVAGQKPKKPLRDALRQDIAAMSPYLSTQDYLLGDDFSIVDCFLMPVLWRLPFYGVELPKQTKAIDAYINRVMSRQSFKRSLSTYERDMRGI